MIISDFQFRGKDTLKDVLTPLISPYILVLFPRRCNQQILLWFLRLREKELKSNFTYLISFPREAKMDLI